MRLLVTRPDEDGRALVELLKARGHDALHAPLMDIVAAPDAVWPVIKPQALIITSANGARFAAQHEGAAKWKDLPVLAVGDASADVARAHGFGDVTSADGDVGTLAALIIEKLAPEAGPLLHIAGTVTAGDLKGVLGRRGFEVQRAVLYEARAVSELPKAVMAAIEARDISGVLIYSPRTARLFMQLVKQAGLQQGLAAVTAFCLSQAVADELAGAQWGEIQVSLAPTQAAMLELVGS